MAKFDASGREIMQHPALKGLALGPTFSAAAIGVIAGAAMLVGCHKENALIGAATVVSLFNGACAARALKTQAFELNQYSSFNRRAENSFDVAAGVSAMATSTTALLMAMQL